MVNSEGTFVFQLFYHSPPLRSDVHNYPPFKACTASTLISGAPTLSQGAGYFGIHGYLKLLLSHPPTEHIKTKCMFILSVSWFWPVFVLHKPVKMHFASMSDISNQFILQVMEIEYVMWMFSQEDTDKIIKTTKPFKKHKDQNTI